jgi:excisionase family DNA binding protein
VDEMMASKPDASTEAAFQERHGAQRLKSIGDAAEYLGVSRATVERLVHRGALPIVKVGGATRYDIVDLDRYIAINRTRNRKRMVVTHVSSHESGAFSA